MLNKTLKAAVMLLFLFLVIACAEMIRFIAIPIITLSFLIIACVERENVKTEIRRDVSKGDYISSLISLNGGNLVFTQYSKGCVHEEHQRIEISKKESKEIVVSYFRNGDTVLDKRIFDSSFNIYIKSFIYECDNLLIDTSVADFWSTTTIRTIQISDGLDIIEVGARVSKQSSPFDDLVYVIYSKANKRMIMDR